ncbi:Yip1 family protein [Sphingomonas colocasiae]|uniref:YIP1 family protein n=1 Tax=Sphingomonas colocasiae TaxID=1848973 RepID=A0ABS7PPG2_9SPHN|nr:Yip1 family protein [Sphingomonas colocasiae]MBY8822889.1 YIP1 family protein [Sphingomonas colocasiae]
MSIVDRAKNILLTPKTEWPVIAAEPASTGSLMTYAAILSVIPMIGSILSGVLFTSALGFGFGINFVIVSALVSFAISLGVVFLMGIISGALAPSFDGKNTAQAGLKLIVYASTPVWVAGILNIVPGLNIIAMLAGLAYGIYLIYLGSTPLMAVPEAKTGGYTAVVVVIWIVLSFVINMILGAAIIAAIVGSAAVGAAAIG